MTSVLNVDTIAAKDGTSPVGLTKQEAIKFLVHYDAVDQQTDGSLNQSSLTDNSTGNFTSAFTTSFSSATDKMFFSGCWNTNNGGSSVATNIRYGGIFQTGDHAQSASSIDFDARLGSSGSANSSAIDYSANYVGIHGDLA